MVGWVEVLNIVINMQMYIFPLNSITASSTFIYIIVNILNKM